MKTKDQKLLLLSPEKRISNKIFSVTKELFSVQQMVLGQEKITPAEMSEAQLILLVGLHSPEDIYARLKAFNQYAFVPPIILISDIIDVSFLAQALTYGVVRYLPLPLDFAQLIFTINQLLEKLAPEAVLATPAASSNWKKYIPSFGTKVVSESSTLILQPELISPYVSPANVAFLNVTFLGKFSLQLQNQYIENLFSKKNKAVLAYMLYHHKKPICRNRLISIFWPYHEPAQARNNLNVAIHAIKRDFLRIFPESPIFTLENDCYLFNANIIIQTDIAIFEAKFRHSKAILNMVNAEKAIDEFKAAVGVYQGDFLERIHEPWTEQKRDHYREMYLLSLNHLGNIYYQAGQYLEAIKYHKLMLEKDACIEEVHRKLMICYHALGRHAKVIRQFQLCQKVLRQELDISPSKKTMALLEELRT